MAPQLIPPDPRFTTASERVVGERLRDALRPEVTLDRAAGTLAPSHRG